MAWLDFLFKIPLYFSHAPFIVLTTVIGFHFYNKRIFGHALTLLLSSMLFNIFLKSLWQSPLPHHLHTHTWSFPSGHMQAAIVFWGWLFLHITNRHFRILVILIWVGIGSALLYFNFHHLRDIIGATLVGGLLLWLYKKLLNMHALKPYDTYFGIFFLPLGLLLIATPPRSFPHSWLVIGSLMGFSWGWSASKKDLSKTKKEILVFIPTLLIGLFCIHIFSDHFLKNPLLQNLIKFSLLGWWTSRGAEKLCIHKRNKSLWL